MTERSGTRLAPAGRETDAELLHRIAARDREAFKTFFGRYAARVKGFLMRAGLAEADADEIAQDVMVQVWRSADRYDPAKAAVSTWVFTIARNRRIDRLRQVARATPDPADPLFVPDPEPEPDAVLHVEERAEALRAAISALGPAQAAVIRASFFDGLTHQQIAERDKLPIGTVKSRIRLAFKALKDRLGDTMREARDD